MSAVSNAEIAVLDTGGGNIRSVLRAVEKAGARAVAVNSPEEVRRAHKLILPGVGHFGRAMDYLRERDLIPALREAAFGKRIPILGICLGMQLMCRFSQEGRTEGLGWFDAEVSRMRVSDVLRHKIPHTGWNELLFEADDPLTEGLSSGTECYFVHAYCVYSAPADQVLCRTVYEAPFISGLRRGNIYGLQFHPEKSHAAGARIIQNFIRL